MNTASVNFGHLQRQTTKQTASGAAPEGREHRMRMGKSGGADVHPLNYSPWWDS
jgi:hypothetical protein